MRAEGSCRVYTLVTSGIVPLGDSPLVSPRVFCLRSSVCMSRVCTISAPAACFRILRLLLCLYTQEGKFGSAKARLRALFEYSKSSGDTGLEACVRSAWLHMKRVKVSGLLLPSCSCRILLPVQSTFALRFTSAARANTAGSRQHTSAGAYRPLLSSTVAVRVSITALCTLYLSCTPVANPKCRGV